MSDNFRFGDPRGTDTSDDMGGCCGKPTGCRIESRGCVRKVEKADWQTRATAQTARHVQWGYCDGCGHLTPEALLAQPGQPMPVYRTPRGRFHAITGKFADSWPNPQSIIVTADGRLRPDDHRMRLGDRVFVEQPMPWESGGWGLSYGVGWRSRTPVGVFIAQYAEGISSGFPWWPVVVFSARAALRWTWRRGWRNAR